MYMFMIVFILPHEGKGCVILPLVEHNW